VRGRRVDGGEYTRVGSSVVSGIRIDNPVWTDRRCQGHGAEGAKAAGSQPTGPGEAPGGEAHGDAEGNPGGAPTSMAAGG